MPGVIEVEVGYTGGSTQNPTYESVCAGDGHTEAYKVIFDPETISYRQLLQVMFEEHDPTSKRKCQYKSAIWPMNKEQEVLAREMIAELEKKYRKTIATEILPPATWWPGESDRALKKFQRKQSSQNLALCAHHHHSPGIRIPIIKSFLPQHFSSPTQSTTQLKSTTRSSTRSSALATSN